jgi:hypothetical protein
MMQRLTAELDRRLVPFEPRLMALDTIPGVTGQRRRSSWPKPAAT